MVHKSGSHYAITILQRYDLIFVIFETIVSKLIFISENGQPFDQEFYLILNVAVGGHFLDGPDPWDEWFYPEAEMWVDWVKFYDLEAIGDLPDYECIANPHATTDELCGATTWACYEQNYAWMGDVCDDSWKRCCQRFQCSHQEVVDQCTKIFAQYDSQVGTFKTNKFSRII